MIAISIWRHAHLSVAAVTDRNHVPRCALCGSEEAGNFFSY